MKLVGSRLSHRLMRSRCLTGLRCCVSARGPSHVSILMCLRSASPCSPLSLPIPIRAFSLHLTRHLKHAAGGGVSTGPFPWFSSIAAHFHTRTCFAPARALLFSCIHPCLCAHMQSGIVAYMCAQVFLCSHNSVVKAWGCSHNRRLQAGTPRRTPNVMSIGAISALAQRGLRLCGQAGARGAKRRQTLNNMRQ